MKSLGNRGTNRRDWNTCHTSTLSAAKENTFCIHSISKADWSTLPHKQLQQNQLTPRGWFAMIDSTCTDLYPNVWSPAQTLSKKMHLLHCFFIVTLTDSIRIFNTWCPNCLPALDIKCCSLFMTDIDHICYGNPRNSATNVLSQINHLLSSIGTTQSILSLSVSRNLQDRFPRAPIPPSCVANRSEWPTWGHWNYAQHQPGTAWHQTATWKPSANKARFTVVLQSTCRIIECNYSIAFIIAVWSLGWRRFTTDSSYTQANCILFGDPKCMCAWRGGVGRGVERHVSQAHPLKDAKTPDFYFILVSWEQEIITFDLSFDQRPFVAKFHSDLSKHPALCFVFLLMTPIKYEAILMKN